MDFKTHTSLMFSLKLDKKDLAEGVKWEANDMGGPVLLLISSEIVSSLEVPFVSKGCTPTSMMNTMTPNAVLRDVDP